MSMWKRLSRALSSNLERFREDPFGALKEDIQSFRADLGAVQDQLRMLEADLERLRLEEEALGTRIRAALQRGERDLGIELASRMSDLRHDKARVERQIESTRRVIARAQELERSYAESEASREDTEPPGPSLEERARETLARIGAQISHVVSPSDPEPPLEVRPKVRVTPAEPRAEPEASKTLGGGPTVTARERERAPMAKTLGGPVESSGSEPEIRVERARAKSASPGEKSMGDESRGELDLVAELERLAKLREAGALDEAEFKAAKQKLLEDL